MSKELHLKATEIIARLIDLSKDEAYNLIELECKGNTELKAIVLELYDSILSDVSYKKDESTNLNVERHKNSDDSTVILVKRWLERIFENKKFRLLFLSFSLLVLFLIGIVIRGQVRRLLIIDTAKHLEDQLFTQYLRMQEWIDNGKSTIRTLATDPELIKIAKECKNLQEIDPSLQLLQQKEKSKEFIHQYRLAQAFVKTPSGIISSESARILTPLYRYSNENDSTTGVRLAKGIYNSYLNAMERTIFVKPLNEKETIYNLPDSTNAWVSCVFFSPIKDEKGELLGILYNSYLANNEFSKVLTRVHFGNEGETYAFDKNGRMLSSGRFVEELRRYPYFNLDKSDETIYNIVLKDPGGEISKGYKPKLEKSQMPFVLPLQELHIELEKENKDSLILGRSNIAYRNYQGKFVISRWIWWPKYNFGVITEVALTEALHTLRFFDYAFLILYLIIFALSFLVYKSNVTIFRFGQKIKDYKQLGQYKLKEQIGEGGFGEVYKAEHAFLKTPVAIKLLKKQFNGTDMLERFEKEVKAISSLSNPNTIKVYDYGNTKEGQFYYVMEYLNGISLDLLVPNEKHIEVGRGIHILISVCFSLQEAHKNRLVHRDIKPGNIMLCSQGGAFDFVKVLDFGLVKSMDGNNADQTQVNRIGGTPMFMAPERLHNPFIADQRVDIYSLGALGVYLFSGKYVLELVSQKMLSGEKSIQADIKTQLFNRNDIPIELKEMLTKCLNFEIEKRPESITVLIEQLEVLREKFPWSRKEAEKWWKAYDVYS